MKTTNLSPSLFSGVGYNVNIPWNKDMMSNSEYHAAFERVVVPIARQFRAELVLVACGFDAAAADLLGEYVLTPPMYGHMTRRLISVLEDAAAMDYGIDGGVGDSTNGAAASKDKAVGGGGKAASSVNLPQGKIVLSLEGGYNSVAIGESLQSCIEALLGEDEKEKIQVNEPCKRAQQSITAVLKEQSQYWKL